MKSGRSASARAAFAMAVGLLVTPASTVNVIAAGAADVDGRATPIPSIRLADLDNHVVDPFLAAEDSRAIVFLFASVDCPISNRYAPLVHRLFDTYASQGVAFWLVYPNPSESADAIRQHVKAFDYPVHALRDPSLALARLTGATITPEAVVYDHARTLVYRGRLDNRYVSLGVERPAATRNDLADALTATLAGRPPAERTTQAVGCFIADFAR